MYRVSVCKVLLIAGSLVGTSPAVAADTAGSRPPTGAKSQTVAAKPSVAVARRAHKPRAAAIRPQAHGRTISWPYHPYGQVVIRWPLLFVGVGY